jgi:hypothetical protein
VRPTQTFHGNGEAAAQGQTKNAIQSDSVLGAFPQTNVIRALNVVQMIHRTNWPAPNTAPRGEAPSLEVKMTQIEPRVRAGAGTRDTLKANGSGPRGRVLPVLPASNGLTAAPVRTLLIGLGLRLLMLLLKHLI